MLMMKKGSIIALIVSIAAATIAYGFVGRARSSAEAASGEPNQPVGPDDEIILSVEQLREILVGVAPFQARLLEDGRLTRDEYRQAFDAFVRCVEEKGGKAQGPVTESRRGKLEVKLAFPGGDGSAAVAAHESCRMARLSVVDLLWSQRTAPSAGDMRRAREALAACLRTQGFSDVPEHPAPGELVAFWPGHGSAVPPVAFAACQERIDAAYDLPGFGG